jgi:ribosomal protein L20
VTITRDYTISSKSQKYQQQQQQQQQRQQLCWRNEKIAKYKNRDLFIIRISALQIILLIKILHFVVQFIFINLLIFLFIS